MSSDDELSQLLSAERGVRPPAEAAEQGLARLLADLAGPATALPVATGALTLGWSLVSKSVLVGFVVGTAGAFGAVQAWPASSSVKGSSETRPAVAMPGTSSAAPGAPLLEPERVTPPAPSATTARGSASNAQSQSQSLAASAPAPTFDEELRLITLAKRALDSGNGAQARSHLLEHARLFPSGVFGVDREALDILTECAGGSRNQRRVRDFAARHPGSPMLDRLERACAISDEQRGRGAFPEIAK